VSVRIIPTTLFIERVFTLTPNIPWSGCRGAAHLRTSAFDQAVTGMARSYTTCS
jgi:hypothetical protein